MTWHHDWHNDWHNDWHGIESDPSVFDGYGSSGVDTLALELENGFTIRYKWITDVIKTRSGREQRISRTDVPLLSFSGVAKLRGSSPRAMRAKLARHAAAGSIFLLGLPHEALAFTADSSSTSVNVDAGALALTDWAKTGQRILCRRGDTFHGAVAQSKTSNTIVLGTAPGAVGKVGGCIMPAVPVYLEPQQNIGRHQTEIEEWKVEARAQLLDYAPTIASVALPGIFTGVTAYAREFGLNGNARTLEIVESPGVGAAGLVLQPAGFTQWLFEPGVSTVGDFMTALASLTYLKLVGSPSNLLTAITGADEFIVACAGGTDAGDVGTGATLTYYAGDGTSRPVWDAPIENPDVVDDGVHALSKIIDHGGLPYSLGTADEPDWFRAVVHSGQRHSIAWQKFKLFMSTVKGRQKAFWLPTWRDDLTFVSKATNTITISNTDESDFFGWWPDQREHIQIKESNGTITRAKITGAVNNGDGTTTLTIGSTLATSSVELISWLELCHWENDEYAVTHGDEFSVSLTARVVQQ